MAENKPATFSDLAKVDATTDDQIARQMAEDADTPPELTDDWFDKADLHYGEKLLRPGRGRLPLAYPKQLVSLRLDRDVIDGFRSGGPGWQSRINAALRQHLEAGEEAARAGSPSSWRKLIFNASVGRTRAVVGRTGWYADKKPALEIHVPKSEAQSLPIKENGAVEIDLKVANRIWRGKLRMTKNCPYVWISPTLMDSRGQRYRLVDALVDFEPNDRVILTTNGRQVEVVREPIIEEGENSPKRSVSKEPASADNLADTIRRLVEPYGGFEVPPFPRGPMRDAPDFK